MDQAEETMDFNFDTIDEISSSMTDFHEELYRLEEEYLDKFGVYPNMPELSRETLEFYVGRIKRSMNEKKRIEDLD